MTDTTTIQWAPTDELRALGFLEQWQHPGKFAILSSRDLARVSVQIMIDAERLVGLRFARSQAAPGDLSELEIKLGEIGGNLELAEKMGAGDHYRAALEMVRLLWRDYRVVTKPDWLIPEATKLPELPKGIAPAVWLPFALKAVGVVAAAVTTYLVADRVCQVVDGTAMAAAVFHARMIELQFRVAKGLPLPPPPDKLETGAIIDKLAAQQKSGSIWLGAGAVATVAALGAGLYYGMKRPLARSSHRRSPSVRERVRQRIEARSNPSHKRRALPRKRKKPRKARNPIRPGYSREVVSANIQELIRAGRSGPQAAAIALEAARSHYRRAHPSGGFPRWLETQAERRGHHKPKKKKARAKPKARPNPKPKARRAKRSRTARDRTARKRATALHRKGLHSGRLSKMQAIDAVLKNIDRHPGHFATIEDAVKVTLSLNVFGPDYDAAFEREVATQVKKRLKRRTKRK